MLLMQADPAMTDLIVVMERIATAQMIMAAVLIIMGVLALGAAVIVLSELRSLRHLLRGMSDAVDLMKPRLAPLFDRTMKFTGDMSAMTDNTRRKVDDLLFTLESLNRAVKRGADATEDRVQRFAAVIDVVQTEAEELLLDAAATARGVHETARLLHEPPARVRRRPPENVATPVVRRETEENEEVVNEGP